MRFLIFTAALLFVTLNSGAQVYVFKPAYSVKMTYGGGDMDELWFEKIDETRSSTFTVDIGNKTITIPDYSTPKEVTDVWRDEQNNCIILKTKSSKDVGQVWCYYEMKLDNEGKPVYIQSVERLTGKRFSEDTFFHMYTNDLRTLSFSRKCASVKSNMALSEDKKKASEEINELFNTKFSDGDNTLEMRNGYLVWKEGKGKKAKVHQFKIDSVQAVSEDGTTGALLRCKADGGEYHVFYMKTKRNLDPSQSSWSRYITMDKYEGTRRRWKIVFR